MISQPGRVYLSGLCSVGNSPIFIKSAKEGTHNASRYTSIECRETLFCLQNNMWMRSLIRTRKWKRDWNRLTLWPLYHFFSKWLSNTLCIYICTVPRRLSAHYAYIYAHFSLFDVFTVALPVTHGVLAGGARLWRSPLQHLPVRFAHSKLHLVREVSPFNSKFTARGSLTWMQSGTPSKLAEGDFSGSFGRGVPYFSGVPHSICQSDLLTVNCVW